MTEQCVAKILKEHEGWECKCEDHFYWRKIVAVRGDLFWRASSEILEDDISPVDGDWLVRPPAPKEKKPSERIEQIIPHIHRRSDPLSDLEAKVLAIIAFLDEQHERAKK